MKPPAAPPPRSIDELRKLTPARVALGRTGASLPTRALLDFTLDHARARDAVHAAFDAAALAADIGALGCQTIGVESCAENRRLYLGRPDLGRRLDPRSAQHLGVLADDARGRVVLVVGDGLSPAAVHAQAPDVMRHLLAHLQAADISVGPVVIATHARVALGDEIGEILGASLVAMLIGERPGLSTPESLGAYLTLAPRRGLTDADRNCVSNIHRAGLTCDQAAFKIAWLIREGIARGVTGVGLKDESEGDMPRAIADGSVSA